jgi:GH25 family lysozyme M1 (1,4-beta-N-acetylmuramidase)
MPRACLFYDGDCYDCALLAFCRLHPPRGVRVPEDKSMTYPIGIDVSRYDVKLNWSQYTFPFAFVKVSEGTVKDPLFDYHWKGAKGHTLRSPYHFFRPFVDPKLSAQTFIAYLGDDRGELPPMFDLEATDNIIGVMSRAKSWLAWYEELTGVRPIIYSSLGFLVDNQFTKHDWLKNYKLHLAQYRYDNLSLESRPRILHQIATGQQSYTMPAVPSPFTRLTFAQWTAKGAPEDVPGYYVGVDGKKAVDLNFYNGTLEGMMNELGVVPPNPTDTGDEDEMTNEQLDRILAAFADGVTRLEAAIKGISVSVPGDTTPPATGKYSVCKVVERDPNPNGRIVVYKTPDNNDTNKATVYVMPAQTLRIFNNMADVDALGLMYFKDLSDAHKMATWRDFACVHQNYILSSSGKPIDFPEIYYPNKIDPATGKPMRAEYCWVHRADLGAVLRQE